MRFEYDLAVDAGPDARIEYFLVPWDTEIFGFTVAQIAQFTVARLGAATELFQRFDAWCVQNQVRLSACRLAQSAMLEIEALQANGFRFVELNYRPFFSNLKERHLAPKDPALQCSAAESSDAEELVTYAGQIFRHGRFHQDPLFSQQLADQRYAAWMANAFPSPHQRIVRCMRGTNTAGFFVIEDPSPDECFWSLLGVAPAFQGGGWGSRIVNAMLHWHRDEGKNRVETSISSHNIAVMNLYVKLDWRFPEPQVSFHRHEQRLRSADSRP